jgi:hypothetical protein
MSSCVGKLMLPLFLGLLLFTNAQVYAEEHLIVDNISELNKVKDNIEFGIEYAELAQDNFRNLGSSNYTFLSVNNSRKRAWRIGAGGFCR